MKIAIFAFPVPPAGDNPNFTIYLGDAGTTTYSGSSVSDLASAITDHRVTHRTSGGHAVVVIDISSMTVTPAEVKAGVSSNLSGEATYVATIVDGLPSSGLIAKTEGVNLGALLAGTAIGALLTQ